MANLNYKPELNYKLPDINTVVNTDEFDFHKANIKVFQSPVDTLALLEDNIKRINDLISIVDDRLKDSAIKIQVGDFEDPILTIIKELPDGERFINEGVLTYHLYKASLEVPILYTVAGIWDEFQAGINGTIEGEVLPYLYEMKYDNEGLRKIMLSTIFYGQKVADREELAKWEVLELEKMLRLQHNTEILYPKGKITQEQYYLDLEEKEKREALQGINIQLNDMLREYAEGSSVVTTHTGSDLDEDTKLEKTMYMREQISDRKSVNHDMENFLIYNSFKDDKEKLFSMKQEFLKTNRKDKSLAYNGYITNNRIVTDIALPALFGLVQVSLEEDSDYYYRQVLKGAEHAMKEHDDASINLKNVITASLQNTSIHLATIVEKDKRRVLYRNVR